MSFLELRDAVRTRFGKSVSTIRVSVGLATNFADVYRFLGFAAGFLDKSAEEIGAAEGEAHPKARDVT